MLFLCRPDPFDLAVLILVAGVLRCPVAGGAVGAPTRGGDVVEADWLTSPQLIVLEIVVDATVEEVLSGEALAAQNREWGIPEDTPPHLMFWCSDVGNHFGQQDVTRLRCSPPPTDEQVDSENGNNLLYWDFSPQLASAKTFSMRRVYRMTLHVFDSPTTWTGGVSYDPWDPEVLFYTKSEPFNELTPEIRRVALKAIGDAEDPVTQAKRIFRWTRGHMQYEYPPPGGRGATVALHEGKGDCGQYADLFIALCRSVGIPARLAAGFALGDAGADGRPVVGSHGWAEFLLPDGRWVPADPTHDERRHFGHLLRVRNMTASVGRNIPLPHAPSWASYRFSDVENGRTEFMQTLTELSNGVTTSLRIQRRLLDPGEWVPAGQ